MNQPASQYRTCFISAPFGLDLEALPGVLEERGISWQWAKDSEPDNGDANSGITSADFVLVILNGTKADYRSTFDAGIAVGLNKPVFLIQTNARALPIDFRRFTTIKSKLSNRDALSLHLDLFLAAPPSFSPFGERKKSSVGRLSAHSKERESTKHFPTQLEKRAYDAVIEAGGSAIAEPSDEVSTKFRPDLLAWLGNLDAELLDPVVIEVKVRVDQATAHRVEEQLLSFMQSARIRTGLVLTLESLPKRPQQLSPNVLWLSISEFENLARTGRLGTYVRETRNRIVHGIQ